MKSTLQRQIILSAVAALDIHATAEQTYEHIKKTHPTIGKATVYRNLKQLADAGELQSIGPLSGAAHYDHNLHEHLHFICNNCGRVIDISGSTAGILNDIEKSDEYSITKCQISFSGLCKQCQ